MNIRAFSLVIPLLMVAPQLPGAEDFSTRLTAEQSALAGLDKLTPEERGLLDAAIGRELTAARQGNVRGFARSFSTRRNPAERKKMGLDKLTGSELASLDTLVAEQLAATPLVSRAPTRVADQSLDKSRTPLEIHGQVELMYGWSKHGDFKGGSITTEIYDPDSRVSVVIGYSRYEGPGWIGPRDCRDGRWR